MSLLVIDSDHYEDVGIETLFFPGGEPHAKLPNFTEYSKVVFIARCRTWDDVGLATCVRDALHDQTGDFAYPTLTVICPYLPGARQDKSKPFPGAEPIMAKVLQSLLLPDIALDLHNPDAYLEPTFICHHADGQEEVLNSTMSVYNFMPSQLGLPMRPEVDFVIAPDKGAVNRARDFANAYCPNASLIVAEKERDPRTGRILKYQLPETEPGKIYLVVDDICDGGATFLMLADEFWRAKTRGGGAPTRLELFVSHGIFSKGLAPLLYDVRTFDHIYTTDSFYLPQTRNELWLDKLTVYSLNDRIHKMLEANNNED